MRTLKESEWPTTLRFGPFDYSLVFVDEIKGDDGGDFYGQTSHAKGRNIEIARKAHNNHWSTLVTLFHEALHAIDVAHGLREDELPEGVVNEMAKGLVAFFRDNPEVTKLIKREEEKC